MGRTPIGGNIKTKKIFLPRSLPGWEGPDKGFETGRGAKKRKGFAISPGHLGLSEAMGGPIRRKGGGHFLENKSMPSPRGAGVNFP